MVVQVPVWSVRGGGGGEVGQVGGGQDEAGVGVGGHEGEPGRGVLGVQGQPGGAGLHDGELGDGQVQAAVE